jgi:outer membrane lipase/esterase
MCAAGMKRARHGGFRSARARALTPFGAFFLGLYLGAAHLADAQTTAAGSQTPSLLTLVTTLTQEGVYDYNALDFAAARADDAAYANLLPICSGTTTTRCTGATLQLYDALRSLEDNANELLGRGQTAYSLRLTPALLANALQWTAPEEYAAQGSMTTQFANSQSSILANRFEALHFAAMATRLADNAIDDPTLARWASVYQAIGGGGGSADSASFGRWSFFANTGFGAGSKDPTVFEDAFNFDSTEVSAGVDYRLNDQLVFGLLAGHSERRIDFNSQESIVNGEIRGNGQSFTLYVQYEPGEGYIDGSVGQQHLSLHTVRRITYPSNNPAIPSVNQTTVSDAGANTTTASVAGGYSFHYRSFSLEPYVNTQYMHTIVGQFIESDGNGFDVSVAPQSIVSTEADAGLKLQYAFSNRFGVIVPYIYGEFHHEFFGDTRVVESSFAAASTATSGFVIPTDDFPRNYYVAGAGGSIVLPHGLQAYAQYLRVLDYTNYTDHVFSGGFRWEF